MRKETVLLCSIFFSLLRSRGLFILYCDNKGSVVIIFPLLCNCPDNERALIHRSPHHFPAGFLRLPGGEEMVGAVLQAALARHHRLLPGRSGGDQRAGGGEGAGQDGEEDGGEVLHPGKLGRGWLRQLLLKLEILIPGLHSLHQENVNKTEEKISQHPRTRQNWNYPSG